MHMVFTGNPGTAKTTVARLFAQIMKDNGLLSKGRLVETGRGELVAKYVGWTAPNIKRKFQEARGGPQRFALNLFSCVIIRNFLWLLWLCGYNPSWTGWGPSGPQGIERLRSTLQKEINAVHL